jgi:translocation and assembly module TamB
VWRRLAIGISIATGVAVLLPLATGTWLLGTAAGSRWLLPRLPGLQAEGVAGALLGDFTAKRVQFTLPDGTHLDLHDLRWSRPEWSTGPWKVRLAQVHAERLEVTPGPSSSSPPPTDLRLPMQIELPELTIGRVALNGGAPLLTDLRAGLDLGGPSGHRLTLQAARWQQVQLAGQASVQTGGELATVIELRAEPADKRWQGQIALRGPLAKLAAQAQLKSAGQSLQAQATVAPFAPWPLAELTLDTQGLDLAALHPEWPRTALSGQARLSATDWRAPAQLHAELRNAEAGRWDAGRLPARQLVLDLSGQPEHPETLRIGALTVEFGTTTAVAGRASGQGQVDGTHWRFSGRLQGLRPEALDGRLAAGELSGPFELNAADPEHLRAQLQWTGRLAAAAQPLSLNAALQWAAGQLEIDSAELRAGPARVTAQGQVQPGGPSWRVNLNAGLRELDPRALWRGSPDAAWQNLKGPLRLNADLALQLQAPRARPRDATGHVQAKLLPSQLGALPLSGQLTLDRTAADQPASTQLDAHLGGAQLSVQAQLSADRIDAQPRLNVPALAELRPLLSLLDPALRTLGGQVDGEASLHAERGHAGWELRSEGRAKLAALALDASHALASADLRWAASTTDPSAPLSLDLQLSGLRAGEHRVAHGRAQASGSLSAHRLTLSADGSSLLPRRTEPQAWLGTLSLQGAWTGSTWSGRLDELALRPSAEAPPWLALQPVALQAGHDPATGWQVQLQAGALDLLGARLSWRDAAWRGGGTQPARAQAELRLEPLAVAPLLARAQPAFGWGGDLTVVGSASLRLDERLDAEVVLQRQSGDLKVSDEYGPQSLGLSDFRFGLSAHDGVWQFTQAVAGTNLGGLGGTQVLRLPPGERWPSATTTLDGGVQAQVANLANWGGWVPAGWRLGGRLAASVQFGGRLNAPAFRGDAEGAALTLRHALYGVDVTGGRFALSLDGPKARLTQFEALAGDGWLRATGEAQFAEPATAKLELQADHLRVLARADRRVVASGKATLQLNRDGVQLDGKVLADEGLLDFSRADAPSLDDDVRVQRGPVAAAPVAPGTPRHQRVDLALDLGNDFKVIGRGLSTQLRGQLKLTQRDDKLSLLGKLRTDGGNYAAYGQKLDIERGEFTFSGPFDNPAIDLLATRPNLDTRVGVRVDGSLQRPRVALYSEPDLPDTDKLSWLLLGRGPDGLGRTDIALLQRAALALLSGEGEGVTGRALKNLGLDELSVSQADDDTRATIVRLGKQLSRRWYVGYERGLNATTGSWQLIYRIAQRFTVRAQSGDDSALDLIWQWRWQ